MCFVFWRCLEFCVLLKAVRGWWMGAWVVG